MGKIFKQLARHWAACLVVFALLAVQAYCDLSLPAYTSNIVDVGIQQGGIESAVPQTVRQAILEALESLMPASAAALVEQWYSEPDETGVRTLARDAKAAMPELERAFTTPDVVLYMASARYAAQAQGTDQTVTPTAADLDALCARWDALTGYLQPEEMQQQMEAFGASMGDSMASQAILLVALEYEAQGVAHDVQMAYLWREGGQMLALTLLMAAVAVAVGFVASRVSAAIGRDLRRETFSAVIGFSHAEIEQFSTASLITRTTNDIQQVQFVCVILLRMVAYAPILGIGGIVRVAQSNTGLTWITFLAVAALLLLMRFYDVDAGAITLNGHNVRDFDRTALREGFGMVLQDTWLFQGTILENIRYGRLDATDEEVIAAAKAAGADHFIRTLPGGYRMELNEDASNVSQGQKQLLTIARTILADNRILVLDEATSSVDTRTEQRIQAAMDRLMQGRTSFIIAHRLSTIRNADLILVMRDGDIVEQGTHDELMQAEGFYAELYNSQFEDVTA